MGVSSRPAPCQDYRAERESVVSLYDGPGAAADPAAFADCVEAIAARADKAAFARLFAHFAPRLKAYLLRLGLGAAQAEEVAQEVMVTVWRKAASFDRRQASAATWIFRIARNRRIDLFRRDQRAALDPNDPIFQPQAEAAPDATSEAADRETQVRLAMAELPADQRELVRAHFYEDLSHSQIAERTGVPLGTVKSRLRLAFGKLRLRLEGAGADA
ncbi:sigma-70 family RNA polymerase sigma factor [Phenylobacterium montanum]|uniref:RNA polymerase sigma factor n=1 Tax=Phenylobacterium montanum TaxID=2823693 RepID=A0A975G5A4_9CAUL|nr:sigma-70 family RNA polymerase sigma factor [Caulobacter sp. S6]